MRRVFVLTDRNSNRRSHENGQRDGCELHVGDRWLE
jgi:hypothetical protein